MYTYESNYIQFTCIHAFIHTHIRGPLADEEERLYRLRQEREGEARKLFKEERERLEKESRETMVCMPPLAPFGEC
jgi:hypothetical protein